MAIDVGKTGFSNTDAFYFTFHKMMYALSKKQTQLQWKIRVNGSKAKVVSEKSANKARIIRSISNRNYN